MLAYFETLDLDYRIIETGIGGLHDKTNVIDPIISCLLYTSKTLKNQNIFIATWTVPNLKEYQRLIDLGVDIIISNEYFK